MVLSVVALVTRDPDPDEDAVNRALSGNLCRCGAYMRVRQAVRRAVELIADPDKDPRHPAPVPTDGWKLPDPGQDRIRPARPWDMSAPEDRDWFEVLGEGLVVVLLPRTQAPGTWAVDGGAWLHVACDGIVTAFTGKVDVGQDNRTALRMLVAEELRVPLDQVRLAMGDTDLCPYDMGTFGSRSMPDAGSALSRVAAFARSLPAPRPGTRRVEIVTGEPVVTPATQWRIAGSPCVPPATIDAVTGARRFVSDLQVPGLRHGAMLRAPVPGSVLRHVDTTSLDGRGDIVVVHTPTGVGLVADTMVVARAALAELKATWEIPEAPSDDELESFLRSHPAPDTDGWGGSFHYEQGDPDGALESAAVRVAATYTTAYIAAVPLETHVSVALWDDDGRLTVWTGSQTPFRIRSEIAEALELDERDVRVIVPPTGGGFGAKHGASVAVEAALCAREAGGPVRVAWTRPEEFSVGTLRPAAVIDVAAGATTDGELTAWTFTNIYSGPAAIAPPYRVPNQRLDHRRAESPLTRGSYRALAATANNFARESHIDELAHRLGLDPVEFRLANLADERLADVLRAVAERVRWKTTPDKAGWGIACGLEKDGRVATAVRVRVGSDGQVELDRLVTAYECGALVNPDTVINQIEGATAMALGGALFEAIRFRAGRITNGTFSGYRVPRISDVPPIEVVLLDRPDLPSAGAGETPMIAVAPAVANAIFHATGQRLRSLPLGVASPEATAETEAALDGVSAEGRRLP